MSKVKAVLDFAEAYDATNPDKQAEHAALEAEVNLLSEQDEWEEHAIHGAVIAAIYADHVTAELQAENAELRAKNQAVAFKDDWGFSVFEKDPISAWVNDYTMICEGDTEYTPTNFEKSLIVDALHGYESEQDCEIQKLRAKVAELESGREWLPLRWVKDDDCMYLDESAVGVSGDDCFIRVCDDDVSLELHWRGVYQGEYYSWAEAKAKANLIYQEFLSERIFKQSEQKGAAK